MLLSRHTRRREFITLIGGTAAAWPLAARAQQPERKRRIGILSPGHSELSDPTVQMLDAFLEGLRELGYTEGQNLTIDRQFADGSTARLHELASELVRGKPEIIVAFSTTATRPAKQASGTIAIVGIAMADPVADDLVASLARPGGNVTGTTFLGPELVAKRLQLLREVVPGLSRVAALWHPNAYSERTMAGILNEIEVAARTLGLQLQLVPAVGPDDFVSAFAAMAREHAQAVIVMPSPMLFGEYKRIVSIATNSRLPAMGAAREFADLGGLMSYGTNLLDLARQTAPFVDKILKGAKPAELPVEQPTKFELVINLKTAKALGLDVPPTLLVRADEVIE
jgi:putative ABC transport system substrate-binding protein